HSQSAHANGEADRHPPGSAMSCSRQRPYAQALPSAVDITPPIAAPLTVLLRRRLSPGHGLVPDSYRAQGFGPNQILPSRLIHTHDRAWILARKPPRSSATDSPSKTHLGGKAMKSWHLPTLEASSDKRTAREPGADAPRVPSPGAQKPRVLFSAPECRLIALDLGAGEQLPEHRVRERAVVQVISGRVAVDASGETVESEAGTLLTFDPGEPHAL